MDEKILDLLNQGITFMKAERYNDAADLFKRVIEAEPENFDAYMHLGNAYVNLDEMDEAIKAFNSALIINKDSGQAYFSLANVYYLKDDNKNAVKNYIKAENARYRTADMYVIMGNIFYSSGDTLQALRYITRAVNEEPLRGELWRQRILLELELGNVETALDSLNEFEGLLPEALDIHELRTKILIDMEKYDEVGEHLERAKAAFPEDMRIRLLQIRLYNASGNLEGAKEVISNIKEAGLDAGYRKTIAMEEAGIFVIEQNPEGIVSAVEWGLEEAKDDSDLLFILLNTYIAQLDYSNIIELSEKLLKMQDIDPSVIASAEFYRALSLRQTGKEEEAQKRFKEIKKTLRKLTIDNPENIDIFMYRLLTHNALKEFDEAFELADYIGKVSSDEASVHAFRSLIYKEMGQQDKADEELSAARKINPDIRG